MNTRSVLTARGWLICAATGLLLMGPAILQAQTGSRGDSTAQRNAADTESTNTNPLFSAVKRELKKLLGRGKAKPVKRDKRVKSTRQKSKSLKKSKSRNRRQSTQNRPGLLPFLQSSQTEVSTTRVRKPTIRPVIRQVRRTTTAVPKTTVEKSKQRKQPTLIANGLKLLFSGGWRKTLTSSNQTVQQTAVEQPIAQKKAVRRPSRRTRGQKTGLLTRFLGRNKRSATRRPSQTKVPPAPARSLALRNIPRLLPKFLQPKSLPQTVSAAATTRPPTASAAGASTTISLNSTTTSTTLSTEFENPFTEVSEAEADGQKLNPFTGLKLEPEPELEQPLVSKTTDDQATTDAETELPIAANEIDPTDETDDSRLEAKMKRLAERAELSGLQGFCPVMLRDHRELIDTDPEFASTHNAKTYQFSSSEAKTKFDANPAKYAPIHDGHDVIVLTEGQVELEGSLENAVWFKDRLYLFSSSETLETFIGNPVKYSVDSDSDESKPNEAIEVEATDDFATDETEPDASNSDESDE